MSVTQITLLFEDLGLLATAAPHEFRCPSLELILARGTYTHIDLPSANHLRFHLYGIDRSGDLPVAALTHVNVRDHVHSNDYFWLRSVPVTMWADMARVFMSDYGFADLDPYERNEIENCIRAVLTDEGINMHSDHPERWCIALDKPLDFEFTPLDEALGMNVADALPEHPEALHWRRILNEIQVALHHCPVNVRRRQLGKQEINSVWFWGGGFIPDAAPHDLFDTVYSNNPVSRGLAIINDCRLKRKYEAEMAFFGRDGHSVLIDWSVESRDPLRELNHMEKLSGALLAQVRSGHAVLRLFDGSGKGWEYDRRSQRRLWRRRVPLKQIFPSSPAE